MRIPLLLLLCCVLLLSCQKEFDPSDPATRTSAGLLKSMTATGDQDSVTSLFIYDANRKIISLTDSAFTPVAGLKKYLIARDAAGTIQSLTQIIQIRSTGRKDTITRKANYNAALQQYESLVFRIEFMGFTGIDSTAFTYNNSGKIIKSEHFQGDASGVAPYEKEEFKYTGENVSEIKKFELIPGATDYELTDSLTLQYDTNKAALSLGNEAVVLGLLDWVSVNNNTKLTDIDFRSGGGEVLSQYTYTSTLQPKTSVKTFSSFSGSPFIRKYLFTYY